MIELHAILDLGTICPAIRARSVHIVCSCYLPEVNVRRLLIVLALVACGIAVYESASAKGNDEAEIRALEQRFATAFNGKDVNAIMDVYVPGDNLFVFDVTPPRQHVGFADYKKDWEDFLGATSGPVKFELTDLSITTDGGNLAYGHSIQHVTGQMKDGKPMDVTVRVTDDYRKVNGKWLIAVEHVSVPVNFETGQPDFQSRP
jgi:ketosteroid isomerase-like protein